VLNQNGNPDHPVTAAFGGLDVYWESPLELNPPEGVDAVPLFYTTADAWSQTKNYSANPEMSYLFQQEAGETRGPKIMGAALSGKFPSWFAGVSKPVREGSEEELPDMPAEPRESRIIVIGDSDFASTLVQYTRSDRNFDLLIKAADWLGNDDDIIGIRNRLPQSGRLDKITDQSARVKAMAFARYFNIVFIPLAVIALGIFRSIQRRRSLRSANVKGKETSDAV
jgi:ABC-type uncharacterized transport system involved in gliding motility auxiliary subunit